MTLPVVWLPGAYSELREAVAHYESIRPELAERFAGEVEETIARIRILPVTATASTSAPSAPA